MAEVGNVKGEMAVILVTIGVAAVCMSGGYGFWEQPLTVKGTIEVISKEAEPDISNTPGDFFHVDEGSGVATGSGRDSDEKPGNILSEDLEQLSPDGSKSEAATPENNTDAGSSSDRDAGMADFSGNGTDSSHDRGNNDSSNSNDSGHTDSGHTNSGRQSGDSQSGDSAGGNDSVTP